MAQTIEQFLTDRNVPNDLAFQRALWAEFFRLETYTPDEAQRTILLAALEREERVVSLQLNQGTVKVGDELLVKSVGRNAAKATVTSELSGLSFDLDLDQTKSLGKSKPGIFAVQVQHDGGKPIRLLLLFLRPVKLMTDRLAVDLVEMNTSEPPDDAVQKLKASEEVVKRFFTALRIRPKVLSRFFQKIPAEWIATNIVPWSTTALVCTGVAAGVAALLPCGLQVIGSTASFIVDVLKSAADALKDEGALNQAERDQLETVLNLMNTTASLLTSGVNPKKFLTEPMNKKKTCDLASVLFPVVDWMVVTVDQKTDGGEVVILTLRIGIQEGQKFVAAMCTDFKKK